ncbi:MraY family glycosyltransferase [Propionibacteriaceae bacterium Y2011]|uniref:MraY family glycosyltransferase n=1 Tax=Microlunatus sp. Y2014 TaxID=3418488 RepID=UPI003B460534
MREYLLVFLVAAAITYLLTGACRVVALRVGAVAKVRDRDVHTIPIPYFGGVAMLFGVGAAMMLAVNLPWLGRHVGVRYDTYAVLAGAVIIVIVGVLDDLFDLNALAKFAGQICAAAVVVGLGVKMLWIPLPNAIISLDNAASTAVTVFFVVLCSNAVNFVDGLDGLATGVVGIGAVAFFLYSYYLSSEQHLVLATTSSVITVALAGICAGFLPHNFSPARIFMGDSGALLLGLLLATSTISLTGQMDSAQVQQASDLIPAYLPLVLPLAILALPFLDLTLAVVRRTFAGRWWFVADKKHIHHRLLERGHSQRRAVLLMYVWSALISGTVVAAGLMRTWWVLVAAVVLAGILTAFTVRSPRQADRTAADHVKV